MLNLDFYHFLKVVTAKESGGMVERFEPVASLAMPKNKQIEEFQDLSRVSSDAAYEL